jgi:hypothetical protein
VRSNWLGAAALGVLLCSAGVARADEPPLAARWHLGFVELHPELSASAVYDDNIFKVNDSLAGLPIHSTHDIYLTVNPRLALRIPFERSYLGAGYGWQAFKYLNAFDNAVDTTIWDTLNNHTAFAEANLKLGRGLGATLRDDLQRKNLFITAVDLTTVAPADRNALRPIGQYHNELKPGVTYRFEDSNFDLDAGYTHSADRFVERRFRYLDKNIHVPRGRVSYRFFPKTAAFVEGEGYLVRYLEPPAAGSFAPLDKRNADGWKSWLGAQGQVTDRMTALAAGGWGRLGYRNPAALPGGSENADTWLARCELNEKFSARTKLTLGATRDFFDSYSTNFYTTLRGYAEVRRALREDLTLVAGGNLFRNHYSRPYARLDRGFLATGKLEMRPLDDAWLKVNAGYAREQRTSSFAWYSYGSNLVFLEAAAEF